VTGDNVLVPIKVITSKFIGSRCGGLVDKPKIFFFLDDGVKRDIVHVFSSEMYWEKVFMI
jgi:hypothetical protein